MRYVRVGAFLLALLSSFAFGFWWKDIRSGNVPSATPFVTLVSGSYKADTTPTELFRNHYNLILSDYRHDLEPDKLKYSGMAGMFASLGDPHTVFLEPRTAEQFDVETSGNFVGIGARLDDSPAGASVYSVFPDAPAARSGIKAGDLITAVDGEEVAGQTTTEIVEKIKGEAGTQVQLRIVREGEAQPLTITVTRAEVIIPSATGKFFEDTGIGYIDVMQFSEPTLAQFIRAWNELESQSPRGLVIDLRDNPGGLLETAVEMLSMFVENKPAVRLETRGTKGEVVNTLRGRLRRIDYPVIVLINENSASASEIFAGVLKDYERASLVGKRTYGKASVQNVWNMIDNSSAKITIAKYYLPGGEDIGRRLDDDGNVISGGVSPDYEVDLELGPDVQIGDPVNDSQLREAIKIIRMKLGIST